MTIRPALLTACCFICLLPAQMSALAAAPDLSITPKGSEQLTKTIESVSLFLRTDRPEITADDLPYRLREDMAALHQALAAYGYYDPVITYLPAGQMPEHMVIDTGPQYLISTYNLGGLPTGETPPETPRTGDPALSSSLLKAEREVLAGLANRGWPLAAFSTRSYIVNHDKDTLAARLIVNPGPQLEFGPITVTGAERVRIPYLLRMAPWANGETYNASLLETYRSQLAATNLFTQVAVTPATASTDNKHLPVTVALSERKPRTIGGSLSYDSGHGPGAEIFWQHRNMWGQAEQLDLTGKLYSSLQEAEARLKIPRWPDSASTINMGINVLSEGSDAFNQTGTTLSLGLEHRLNAIWLASADTRLSIGEVDQDLVTQLAIPLALRGDTSDDKLNPSHGWRSETILTPTLALSGEKTTYATWEQRLSAYLPLTREAGHVLAGWAHVGGTVNATRDDLAASSLFYSGGGGSVRGYEYRSIGDRQPNGDPLGGTAIAEGGAEIRSRITEKVGAVIFAEFGSVSASALPTFERPQYAAGLGLRYMTSLAPVRFDIAVPLNPRSGDSKFQFYISMGQAF